MECPNCSMNLERIEDKLKGVLFAEASYRREQMVVEYDERLIDLDQIKAEVKRLGYEVTGIL
jgi:copper chaperone CopZ